VVRELVARRGRPSVGTVVLAFIILPGLWLLAHTARFLSEKPDPADLALFSSGTPVQGRDFDAGLFIRHEPDGEPFPGQAFKVEVQAADGSVVFDMDGKADKHGFAAVKVPASRLAKGGGFKLLAKAGESKVVIPLKPVSVPAQRFVGPGRGSIDSRQVLPALPAVAVDTSKGFYFPGDTMAGTVRGAPNSAVKLRISLENPLRWKREEVPWWGVRETLVQDPAPKRLAEFVGKTDVGGVYQFTGKAAKVYDDRIFADHDAIYRFDAELGQGGAVSRRVLVTTRPYRYSCFPEGGTLLAGKTGRAHFLVFNPDGTPAPAVNIILGGEFRATTGADGAAVIELPVGYGGARVLSLDGVNGKYDGSVDWGSPAPGLAIIPSRPLCDQGGMVKVDLRASADGMAYVEVLKDGLVADTVTVALRGGSGAFDLSLAKLGWGDLELRAGALLKDGAYVSTVNGLRVRPNRWLKVDATPRRIQVSDQEGRPVKAGVSLRISRGGDAGGFELQPSLGEAATRLEMAKQAMAANLGAPWWWSVPDYPERARALDMRKRVYCERFGFWVVWGLGLLLLVQCCRTALGLRQGNFKRFHFIDAAVQRKVVKLGAGRGWLGLLGLAGAAAVLGAYWVKQYYVYIAFHAIPTILILNWVVPCLAMAVLPLFAYNRNYRELAKLYPGAVRVKLAIAGIGDLYELYLVVCAAQTAVVMLFPGIDNLTPALYLDIVGLLFILALAGKAYGNVQKSLISAAPSLLPHGLGTGLGGEPASRRPLCCFITLIWVAQCVMLFLIFMAPLAMFMPFVVIVKKLGGGGPSCGAGCHSFLDGVPREMDYVGSKPCSSRPFALQGLPPEPLSQDVASSTTLLWDARLQTDDNGECAFSAPVPPWTLEAVAIDADGRMGSTTFTYNPQKRTAP